MGGKCNCVYELQGHLTNKMYSQQMKLVDFCDLVTNNEQDDDKFWDWLDSELAAVRDKYQAEEPVKRTQAINL